MLAGSALIRTTLSQLAESTSSQLADIPPQASWLILGSKLLSRRVHRPAVGSWGAAPPFEQGNPRHILRVLLEIKDTHRPRTLQ